MSLVGNIPWSYCFPAGAAVSGHPEVATRKWGAPIPPPKNARAINPNGRKCSLEWSVNRDGSKESE